MYPGGLDGARGVNRLQHSDVKCIRLNLCLLLDFEFQGDELTVGNRVIQRFGYCKEPEAVPAQILLQCEQLFAKHVSGGALQKLKGVCVIAVPPDLNFPDDELCILLSNLLENAVEALSRQTEGEKELYLRGDFRDGRLGLVVRNSFSGQVHLRNERYVSTKHEGFGLGLASVRTIEEKYGGLTSFSVEDGFFQASVWVPLFRPIV